MLRKLFIVVAVTMFLPAVAAAHCPEPYTPSDRLAVRTVFHNAEAILERMHELAILTLAEGYSLFQRQALELEFVALRSEINRLGNEAVPGVTRRTRRFLDHVIDEAYLEIGRLRTNGGTIKESNLNAKAAALQIQRSTVRPWYCF